VGVAWPVSPLRSSSGSGAWPAQHQIQQGLLLALADLCFPPVPRHLIEHTAEFEWRRQGPAPEPTLVATRSTYGGWVKHQERPAHGSVAPRRPPTDPEPVQVASDRSLRRSIPAVFRRFSISEELFVDRLDLTSEIIQRDQAGSVFCERKAAIPGRWP